MIWFCSPQDQCLTLNKVTFWREKKYACLIDPEAASRYECILGRSTKYSGPN